MAPAPMMAMGVFMLAGLSGEVEKLILGALMRKLVAIAYGVLKSGKPFNPALHAA